MSDVIAWMVKQATEPTGYEIKGLPSTVVAKRK
jgi:hypothetical protein